MTRILKRADNWVRTDTKLTSMRSCDMLTDPSPAAVHVSD